MIWPTDTTFLPKTTSDVVTSVPSTEVIDTTAISNEEKFLIGLLLGYLAAIFLGDIL